MKKLITILALVGVLSLISVVSAQSSLSWGSFGNESGQFYGMSGIAADTSGNIYVAELDNRVQKFSGNGEYLTQFNIPARGIAVDLAGNIYATVNDSIQKFDSNGTPLNTWGSTGTENGFFKFPTGVALDSSGNIYVSDMDNNRIQKLDSSGNHVTSWGTLGSGNENFKSPAGIAINGDYVYVADMGNYRIQKFDLDGNYVSSLGSKGTGDTQFNSSVAVAMDSSGNIYVADYYNGRVLEYDSNFTYLTQYTGFSYPTALVKANNNLYILDSGNYQVVFYNNTTLTPAIIWSNPANIINGTALNETQLNAVATDPETGNQVLGNFTYTPAAGTVLNAGTHTLYVDFTPNDTANYTNATANVTLSVSGKDLVRNGLVAYYDGNLSGNSLIDLSGNGNIGYATSVTSGTNPKSSADYINLNGVNSKIDVSNNAQTNISSPVTVEFIGSINNFTQYGALASTYNDGGLGWYLSSSSAYPYNHARFAAGASSDTLNCESDAGLVAGRVYHIVATYDNSTARIYINGVDSGSSTWNSPIIGSPENITIGGYGSSSGGLNYCNCSMYTFRLYNRSLSPAEVRQNYEYDRWRNESRPTITWNTPADIKIGTPLSETQLNAVATDPETGNQVLGNFAYTPAAGTVLSVGTHTLHVDFTPTDAANYTNATANVTINVFKNLPVANFTANKTAGDAPLTVQFNDSSENATSVAWDFESDGIVDSNVRNPVHVFTVPGNYTVNLTAINEDGTDSKDVTIYVSDPVPPVANFTANPTKGIVPLTVQFTDTSTNNPDEWNWDFGDGNTSTERNPVHTYYVSRNYTVRLNVSNAYGSNNLTKPGLINIGYVTEGLVAYYDGNLSGNSLVDLSGNSNTGYATNAIQRTNQTTGANYINLTGVNSKIDVSNNAQTNVSSLMSIEFVGSINNFTRYGAIVSKHNNWATDWYLACSSDSPHNHARFAAATGSGWKYYESDAGLVAGKVYHVVVTYDNNTSYIYINGKNSGSSTWNSPIKGGTQNITIGSGYGLNYSNCNMYTFRLYNRSLSSDEVRQNYEYDHWRYNGYTNGTTPTITWSIPANITYGTVLNKTHLNAVASDPETGSNVAGNFTYTPEADTLLGVGTHDLHVDFRPSDTVNYTNTSKAVTLNVSKATPLITWNDPADITSGTPLSEVQLDASASIPGAFAYDPASGTVLNEGTHTLRVDFTPNDTVNYTNASKEVTLNVSGKDLVRNGLVAYYDGNLSGNSLVDLGGNSNTGYATNAIQRTNQTTGANYINLTGVNSKIDVSNNAQTNVSSPMSIEFIGSINSFTQYGAVVSKHTNWVTDWYLACSSASPYNHARFAAGTGSGWKNYESDTGLVAGQVYHIVATYDNSTVLIYIDGEDSGSSTWNSPIKGGTQNITIGSGYQLPNCNCNMYTFRLYNRSLNQSEVLQNYEYDKWRYNKTKATPAITWSNPAEIIYGTALNETQLNAVATDPVTGNNVNGSFVYDPAAETVLSVGTHTLHVDFTPTDTANYTNATADVTINVNSSVTQKTPTITWNNPADITYGTALSEIQLNAVATDPVTGNTVTGTFVYIPAEGTLLVKGTHTLHVDFTPTDTANYITASKDVTINVNSNVTSQILRAAILVDSSQLTDSNTLTNYNRVRATFDYFGYKYDILPYSTDSNTLTPYQMIVALSPTTAELIQNYTTSTGKWALILGRPAPALESAYHLTYKSTINAAYDNTRKITTTNPMMAVKTIVYYSKYDDYVLGSGVTSGATTDDGHKLILTYSGTNGSAVILNSGFDQQLVRNFISIADPAAVFVTGAYPYARDLGIIIRADDLGNDPASRFTDWYNVSNDFTLAAVMHNTKPSDVAMVPYADLIPHSYDHVDLSALSDSDMQYQAQMSMSKGTELFGRPPIGFVAPYNYYTYNTTRILYETGFRYLLDGETDASNANARDLQYYSSKTDPNSQLWVMCYNHEDEETGYVPQWWIDDDKESRGYFEIMLHTTGDTSTDEATRQRIIGAVYNTTVHDSWFIETADDFFTHLEDAKKVTVSGNTLQVNGSTVAGLVLWQPSGTSNVVLDSNIATIVSRNHMAMLPALSNGTYTFNYSNSYPKISAYTNGSLINNGYYNIQNNTMYFSIHDDDEIYNRTNVSLTGLVGTTLYLVKDGANVSSFTPTNGNYTLSNLTEGNYTIRNTPLSTAIITWNTPANITSGTPLSSTQLNAQANVPGTFTYNPAEGAYLGAGQHTLYVNFTPSDTANYTTASKEVTINVTLAVPVTDGLVVYYDGNLSGSSLVDLSGNSNAGYATNAIQRTNQTTGANYVNLNGVNSKIDVSNNAQTNVSSPMSIEFIGSINSFTQYGAVVSKHKNWATDWYLACSSASPYNHARFAAGTGSGWKNCESDDGLVAGQVYHIVATYDNSTARIYIDGEDSGSSTWNLPVKGGTQNITIGSGYELPNCNCSMYAFRLYNRSLNQSEVLKNYEYDLWRYNKTKATPTITWSNPAAITYGTALSETQLNAKASVPGNFVYNPASGTVPIAGTHTLQTTFTPTDSANYTTATRSVSLTVNKATPVITWNNPADITNGTALSETQLNAKASVAGTFVYTPEAGTVLNAGTHILHVDFTPANTANYKSASKDVTINVASQKTTPIINWTAPEDITYGTALTSTQLNALASVPGIFVYTPASGAVLSAGTHNLFVDFTPTDLTNYTTASGSVSLTVNKALPLITWSNPADIPSGTPLGETQLNASASVPGSFVYTPAAGTVLSEGTHTLQAAFTPADVTNYTTASSSVLINVVNNAPAKSASGNKENNSVKLKILEPNSTQSSNSTQDIGKEIKPKSGNKSINEDTGKEINSGLGNETINQHNKSKEGLQAEQKETRSIPGFGIVCGVTCLLGVLLYKRK